MKPKGNPNPTANREQDDFPAYPQYGAKEDIYRNAEELQNVDPERPDREKKTNAPTNEPTKSENMEAGEFVEGSANQLGSIDPIADEDDENEDLEEDLDDEDLDDNDDLEDGDADLTDEDRMILDATPNTKANKMANGYAPVEELDVPGAELDDDMEAIGSEDEENNYYSRGDVS